MVAFNGTGMRGVFGTNVQNVAGSYFPYLEVMQQL
jgi:hypothetical protein